MSSTTTSAAPTFDNYLSFTNVLWELDALTGMLATQYIGGCGAAASNGVLDAVYTTELWTCGDGSYWFTTFTDAWFDADLVNTVGVTTYAMFEGAEYGVAAFCDRYLDTNTSFGDPDGTFTNFGNVCGPAAAAGNGGNDGNDGGDGGNGGNDGNPGDPGNPGNPGTPVPEPASLALLMAGALGFAARVARIAKR